jgi:hypothetical protein
MKVREIMETLSALDPDARCGMFDGLDLHYFQRIDVFGIGGNAEVYFSMTRRSPSEEREIAEKEQEERDERERLRREREKGKATQ